MIVPFLAHLAGSTLCAVLAIAFIRVLRVRRAGPRHAIWFLAICQFAVPAALLGSLGNRLRSWFPIPPTLPQLKPLAPLVATFLAPPAHRTSWDVILLALWLAGFLLTLGKWLRRLTISREPSHTASVAENDMLDRLRATAGIRRSVALRHSACEPGMAGFWRPTILIPRALEKDLEPAEFEAVLLHELAHVRRGDNLWSAAAHLVSCLFWFYPLLRWLERRLMEEGERACDELVLRWGAPPDRYAAAILKVCRAQIAPLPAGTSGIGSGLAARIDWILSPPALTADPRLSKYAPILFAGILCAAPFAIGLVASPPVQCWSTVPYNEGAVIRNGAPYDQMCVADEQGHSRWVNAAKALRPRVGAIVIVPPPDPQTLVCKPALSTSVKYCLCSNGRASSQGAVLFDETGRSIACDQGIWRTYSATEVRR